MNRLNQTLSQLKADKRKALATYIVSGDPSEPLTLNAMHALVDAGADIIELGIPFSDPMAEGPVIQLAHERALAAGASLKKTLALVASFRKANQHTPVVLMGYANPIEKMGYRQFTSLAKQAEVDAVLTVDLPMEEAKGLDEELKAADIENILLVAPTSAPQRVADIAANARGFVYYVSVAGVTGANQLDISAIAENVRNVQESATSPVLVGFGIKDADSAQQVASVSDGVIVGSALVKIMAQYADEPETMTLKLKDLVKSIRDALDQIN